MPSSQLWRAVLSPSSTSADEQAASPDGRGSYGDLADAIDQAIRQAEDDERDSPGA